MVRILTNDDIGECVSVQEVLDSLTAMYREVGEGTAIARPRTDVHAPTSGEREEYFRFKTYGGLARERGVYALRINSDVLRWVNRDTGTVQEKLPRADGERYVGLLLLFDSDTGTPLAMMPDGYIQKLRVGGTSAIGAKQLARPDANTFGLLGAGWQAEGQLAAMNELFDLNWVSVYSPTPKSREDFAAWASDEFGLSVRTVDRPKKVFEADIVHSATNSRSQVFDVDWLREGAHLGSINRLEMDPRALEECDPVIVHTQEGKLADYATSDVDDGSIPYLGAGDHEIGDYPELSDLLVEPDLGRTFASDRSFFFNNQGIGTQFAAVAASIYETAEQRGLGHTVPTELFTQSMVP